MVGDEDNVEVTPSIGTGWSDGSVMGIMCGGWRPQKVAKSRDLTTSSVVGP